MSTRSSIAVQHKDGTVSAIYCHFDGYLDGVGENLLENFNDLEKAEALVRAGDCSTPTEPYTSRGESYDDVKPHMYQTLEDYQQKVTEDIGDNGYRYIFTTEWKAWGNYDGLNKNLTSLKVAIDNYKAQQEED